MTLEEIEQCYKNHTLVWGLEKNKNLVVSGFVSKFSGKSVTIVTLSKKYKAAFLDEVFSSSEEALEKRKIKRAINKAKKYLKNLKKIESSLAEEYD